MTLRPHPPAGQRPVPSQPPRSPPPPSVRPHSMQLERLRTVFPDAPTNAAAGPRSTEAAPSVHVDQHEYPHPPRRSDVPFRANPEGLVPGCAHANPPHTGFNVIARHSPPPQHQRHRGLHPGKSRAHLPDRRGRRLLLRQRAGAWSVDICRSIRHRSASEQRPACPARRHASASPPCNSHHPEHQSSVSQAQLVRATSSTVRFPHPARLRDWITGKPKSAVFSRARNMHLGAGHFGDSRRAKKDKPLLCLHRGNVMCLAQVVRPRPSARPRAADAPPIADRVYSRMHRPWPQTHRPQGPSPRPQNAPFRNGHRDVAGLNRSPQSLKRHQKKRKKKTSPAACIGRQLDRKPVLDHQPPYTPVESGQLCRRLRGRAFLPAPPRVFPTKPVGGLQVEDRR